MSDAETALKRKALMAGMPYGALLAVYKKGIGAWRTNPESVRVASTGAKDPSAPRSVKMGKEQWAMARVNAFITKKPTVFTGADDAIRRRYGLK
jgi:hypothetical protein